MTQTTWKLQEAAEPVKKLAAELAEAGELNKRLDQSVVDAIIDAGFARHFVPQLWGGLSGSFTEATRAVSLIGEGCASAAWLASVIAYSGRFASYLPEQAQAEIWGDGPDHVVTSALVPSGRVEQVPGGWQISGDWLYISGAEIADWALVCGPVPKEGAPPPQFFSVPRADYDIKQTWNSVGMRATMSHTLHIESAFVPDYRSFSRSVMLNGQDDPALPACQRAPLRAAGGLAFAAPIIGSATGALNATVQHNARRRGVPRPGGDSRVHLGLTLASGEIEAARLLLQQVAQACDDGRFGPEERTVHGRDAAVAASLAVTAVDRLLKLGGTAGFSQDSPLQRHWRDVNCAVSHHAVQLEAAAMAFGPVLLAQGR